MYTFPVQLPAIFRQERILGGAFVLALTQFGASVVGLIRDRMLTKTFPGLDVVDVYIAAFRPSDFLFQIAVMAALGTVFVPMLARYHAHRDDRELSKLLSSVIVIGSVVFGVIALLLAFVLPWLARFLVGFKGESLALYVQFARIALLTNFLFVAGNALGQHLVTVQRYWIYGLTPILYTVGTIFGTLVLTPRFGAYGPMLGTLGGAVVYVLLRFFGSLQSGFTPRALLWHPDLLRMGVLMLPRMLALGALQFELLFFDGLASRLPSGAVTINAYTRNFQSVAVGVIGIALAQSVFSLLSQTAAKGEWGRYRIYLKKGLGLLLLFTIPAAVLLATAAPIAAWLVHLQSVLPVFTVCLMVYALSLPFESIAHLLLRAYYATHRTGIPAAMNVLNGIVAVGGAWLLVPRFGIYSLAIGYALGQIVQMTGLAILLPHTLRTVGARR